MKEEDENKELSLNMLFKIKKKHLKDNYKELLELFFYTKIFFIYLKLFIKDKMNKII